MKKIACLIFAMATATAFAVGKGTDSTGEYWEDANGVKHYYLFLINRTQSGGTYYAMGYYAYSREKAQAGDENNRDTSWIGGSIFTLEKDSTYGVKFSFASTNDLYGIELETLNGASAPHDLIFEGRSKFNLGEYGIHSVSGNTLRFMRSLEGVELHIAASQTWSGPSVAELSSAPFVIVPNYIYNANYRGYVTAEDDTVLTIEGDTVVCWVANITNLDYIAEGPHPLDNMDMVIKAPALVSLAGGTTYGYGNLNVRKLTFDGGCGIKFGADLSYIPKTGNSDSSAGASTYGIGSRPIITPVRVAETIVLTNGATLTALETTSVSGGVRIVSAGSIANAFSGTFNLLDAATVIDIEDGATLDLTGATFTGNGKYSVTGSGTLKLDAAQATFAGLANFRGTLDATPSRLFVTDEEVTGEVVVNNGETLLVCGNGLGANSSLMLWGGSTVEFHASATVAAPTWHTNTVYYKTFDASVTGTVAGVMSIAEGEYTTGTTELRMDSPGELRFTGGGKLKRFRIVGGNVVMTGEYDVYGHQYFEGGHMTLRDGGTVKVTCTWQNINLAENASKDACLEIASGGHYEIASGNCRTYIGRPGAAYESKLLINGGTFIQTLDLLSLRSGGTIEVRDGTFQSSRRITCEDSATAASAKVVLGGGVVNLNNGQYARVLFDGAGFCTVNVDGKATLKYNTAAALSDSANDTPNATWTCTEGSRLKIVNPNLNDCSFTMHNFKADGLVFDLNTSDYNSKPLDVKIAAIADPVGIGWVLPGKTGCKVMPVDASPAVLTTYVAPAGTTMDIGNLPSGWLSGFGAETVSNIVFDAGSSLRFPFYGNASPLVIPGSLTLPDSMSYSVVKGDGVCNVADSPVIVPARGANGNAACAFTSAGGVKASAATLAYGDGALRFTYTPPGMVITFL